MQTLFIILPYLSTNKPFFVAGTSFRSSQDTSELTTDESEHLVKIISSFYLMEDKPIAEVVFALLHLSDNPEEINKQLRQLRAAHTILTYLITDDGYDTYEQCTMYLFHPTQVIDSEQRPALVPGYAVTVNWLYQFEMSPGKQLYPSLPYPLVFIPKARNLSDIHHYLEWKRSIFNGLESFIEGEVLYQPEQKDRFETILQAMDWYNRSFSRLVSEQERLVHVAIAFEILFHQTGASSQKIRDELKTHLWGLFGDAKRLQEWVDQFYSVRSSILHEGSTASLNFVAGDKRPSEQQLIMDSLVSYGQRLLRLCILNILHGTVLAEEANLNAWFIHDKERLEEACKLLRDQSVPAKERLLSVITSMSDLQERWLDRRYEREIEFKTIHATGRLLIQTFLEAYPETKDVLREKLVHTTEIGLDNPTEMVKQYEELAKILSQGEGIYKDKYWPRQPAHALTYFAKFAGSPMWALKALTIARRGESEES
jgi:hypothetical protein